VSVGSMTLSKRELRRRCGPFFKRGSFRAAASRLGAQRNHGYGEQ
jgi:hypothetical protein